MAPHVHTRFLAARISAEKAVDQQDKGEAAARQIQINASHDQQVAALRRENETRRTRGHGRPRP